VKNIKVVELFAGVGGFRLGLEQSSEKFNTVWANQWEPNKKVQHAFNCYTNHFGENQNHVNEDIHTVLDNVPNHDLLVGGFPCQDYSVARTQARGIEGKKGVLWWDINDIIKSKKPSFVILENVDRLLRSPSSQRGRDFGIILRCLNDLGYAVEWRVVNAAEYGFAQRRRRAFIFAYKKTTKFYKNISKIIDLNAFNESARNLLFDDSFFAPAFPVDKEFDPVKKISVDDISSENYSDLTEVSESFKSDFYNAGIMFDGKIFTQQTKPISIEPVTLREIIHNQEVDERFFLNGRLEKWTYLKGAKKVSRVRPNGVPYTFAEGNMKFPDDIDLPARTMLTSESSVNRSTHVVKDFATGRLRKLTPIECERLNGFDDNWTNTGMPEKFRYFCMGNALVVPVVKLMGDRLLEIF
jgi:DNA (cytosine-5)-methyltransferase 1